MRQKYENLKARHFNYQVLGTDISQEMVRLCEAGEYSGRAIEMLKKIRPDLFSSFMEPTSNPDSFKVRSEIKTRIRFQQHNLFKSLNTRGPFDLVLVRNVLIYFATKEQEKAIDLIVPKMKEDGCLIIGESESLTHIQTSLLAEQPLIYRKAAYMQKLKGAA